MLRKPFMEPSRNLYESTAFFGLTHGDLLVGTVLLTSANKFLAHWHLQLWAYAVAGLFFVGMSRLRLNTRKGIIGDYISFHLNSLSRRRGLSSEGYRSLWITFLSKLRNIFVRLGVM